VKRTPQGQDILGHFLFAVCGCKGDWSMESFIEEKVQEIREQAGDKKRALRAERRGRFFRGRGHGASSGRG